VLLRQKTKTDRILKDRSFQTKERVVKTYLNGEEMTRLKAIGCYSIDSENSFTCNAGHWSGWAIVIFGSITQVVLSVIYGTKSSIPALGFLISIIGVIVVLFTAKNVPAFKISLNDNSKKYPYIDSETVIITKDIDKMAVMVQNKIDYFTKIANNKILESKEKQRTESCMNDLEQKIITRIK